MLYAGIDIGSTCTKAIVMDSGLKIQYQNVRPTGWDSVGTAQKERQNIEQQFAKQEIKYVATGYGRVAVPYAAKTVTEITCHGKGAAYLFGSEPCAVLDIGGQDTKIISMKNGQIKDFIMNDKCSAGTGRFLEIMAAILGVSLDELCKLAICGQGVTISSMCTVFAESEVISLIGQGASKHDIAFGVIDSITNKVKQLAMRLLVPKQNVYLTGGLCELPLIATILEEKLECTVRTDPLSRYAGAIGAALVANSSTRPINKS